MKKSKFSKAVSGILNGAVGMCEKAVKSPRFGMVLAMLCMVSVTFAQNSAGDYSAGTTALGTVTTEIAKYVPVAVKLCYAIAGVVAVVGAISVYIKMNNEEQDVKKSIMMLVGACIFLIAAAQALPLFFGLQRPLEFLGFQGRYIYWAAGTAGGAIVAFIVGYVAIGFVAALILCTAVLAFGGVMTFLKQRKGLHSKNEEKGVFVLRRTREF